MIEVLDKEIEKEVKEKPEINFNVNTLLNSIGKIDYSDFLVLILKVNYKTDYSSLNMFGKSGLEYILSACKDLETKIINYNQEDDIIKEIKQNVNNKKYVLVLFADTPLLRKKTIYEILDYFIIKKLCALKFNRGFCFETDYLKKAEKIYNPQQQTFEEEDFYKVFDSASFSIALNILKNRILSYHQKNGVIINNLTNVYVDADVNIEKEVSLNGNITLKGKTIIKENANLENAFIENAIVDENVVIENSIIKNSVVYKNSKVTDFSVIKNSTINENSLIVNKSILD